MGTWPDFHRGMLGKVGDPQSTKQAADIMWGSADVAGCRLVPDDVLIASRPAKASKFTAAGARLGGKAVRRQPDGDAL